jgi:drug/metabolite transporter (DMT)-like permease
MVSVHRQSRRITRGERLGADLTLLAAATIWGSSFVACRVAAAYLDPFLYNGLRFFVAVLTLLPFVGQRLRSLTRVELWGGALVGLLLFGASSVQQVGLGLTTAGKAGLITGLYVVLVPLILALMWRRCPRWSVWIAALLAVAGLFFLSGLNADIADVGRASGAGQFRLTAGDAWIIVAAVVWAFHVVFIGQLAPRVNALRLALVQYLVCGLLSLALWLGRGGGQTAWTLIVRPFVQDLRVAWWAVLYTGVFSIGLGFTLQVVGQQRAPATDAAVIMSMETVFAALFGWLLLGETLLPRQLLGCALMLAGMLLAQVSPDAADVDRGRSGRRSVDRASGSMSASATASSLSPPQSSS